MTWTVRKPRFEVKGGDEQGWYWSLINGGEVVAESIGAFGKEEVLDFIRFLKFHAAEVPITGHSVLEI